MPDAGAAPIPRLLSPALPQPPRGALALIARLSIPAGACPPLHTIIQTITQVWLSSTRKPATVTVDV